MVRFSVCAWSAFRRIGGFVDVFFTYGEYGFSFMRNWCYSREWV